VPLWFKISVHTKRQIIRTKSHSKTASLDSFLTTEKQRCTETVPLVFPPCASVPLWFKISVHTKRQIIRTKSHSKTASLDSFLTTEKQRYIETVPLVFPPCASVPLWFKISVHTKQQIFL
jgi:hypothetical protein